MRSSRLALFAASSCAALAVIPACLGPTQVTLDIQKDAATRCDDLHETSIVVAIEPTDAETRASTDFYTATTRGCDPVTNKIGTLVVTPSDAGRASVVVVVATGPKTSVSQCKTTTGNAKDSEFCIFARRRFSFAEHEKLSMPITLDIDCSGKPCDAYSTCKKGVCYSSEAERDGSGFKEPDKPAPVDAGGGGVDGGGTDAPADAPPDGSGPVLPYCTADSHLHCLVPNSANAGALGDGVCATRDCCPDKIGAVCNSAMCSVGNAPYCCNDTQCAAGWTCGRSSSAPGRCVPPANQLPNGYCAPPAFDTLHCRQFMTTNNVVCGGGTDWCCDLNATAFQCTDSTACDAQQRYCCVDADCKAGENCTHKTADGLAPGFCKPKGAAGSPAYCDVGNMLVCGAASCGAQACCRPAGVSGGDATCRPACLGGEERVCCNGSDCSSKTCQGAPDGGISKDAGIGVGLPQSGGTPPRVCQ